MARVRVAVLGAIAVGAVACTTGPPPCCAFPVAKLEVVSGTGQAAHPGGVLAESLVVRAISAAGRPVSAVTITWTVSAGGGSISPAQSSTDSAGRAAARWTIGLGGNNRVTATAENATATFSARALTTMSPITWRVESSGTTQTLHAVWGSSGTNVYAVGDANTVLHFDGSAWSAVQDAGIGFFTSGSAIWGSSASDVFIGTEEPHVIHFDGQHWSWTGVRTGLVGVQGLWGDGPTDVFAMTSGNGTNIWHFDGSTWTGVVVAPYAIDTSGHDIYCSSGAVLGGVSPTNLFMFDACNVLQGFDGVTWTAIIGASVPHGIKALWGIPGAGTYAIGGLGNSVPNSIYVSTAPGSPWTQLPGAPRAIRASALWGSAANDLFAAGTDSIYHFDGTQWTTQGDPTWRGLAIYGPSLADVFVVGTGGFILHGRR